MLLSTIVVSDGKITHELAGLPLTATENLFDELMVLAGDPAEEEDGAYP